MWSQPSFVFLSGRLSLHLVFDLKRHCLSELATFISTACGDSKTFLASFLISTGLDLDTFRIIAEGGSLGTLLGSSSN